MTQKDETTGKVDPSTDLRGGRPWWARSRPSSRRRTMRAPAAATPSSCGRRSGRNAPWRPTSFSLRVAAVTRRTEPRRSPVRMVFVDATCAMADRRATAGTFLSNVSCRTGGSVTGVFFLADRVSGFRGYGRRLWAPHSERNLTVNHISCLAFPTVKHRAGPLHKTVAQALHPQPLSHNGRGVLQRDQQPPGPHHPVEDTARPEGGVPRLSVRRGGPRGAAVREPGVRAVAVTESRRRRDR